jgi:isoleucyl-tRNA synthetase
MKDEKGEEMHKSKGNSIEFNAAAEQEGADSMRWLYASHNPEYDLWFGYNKIHEARRQFLVLWNVYEFFLTYSAIDKFDPAAPQVPYAERPELDRWILARLEGLIQSARTNYDRYSVHLFMREVVDFIDAISRWYLRRSRRRFWKSDNDSDKLAVYQTLWECLVTTAKLLSPVIPFMTEAMYQELVRKYDHHAPVSVHLCDFPETGKLPVDEQLLRTMDAILKLVELGHNARQKAKMKVRQPLAEIVVVATDKRLESDIQPFLPLVLDELNIKSLRFIESASDLYKLSARFDAKTAKPKYGRQFGSLMQALASRPPAEIEAAAKKDKQVSFTIDGETIEVPAEEIIFDKAAVDGWEISDDQNLFVAISTTLTTELIREGLVRDLVRNIQNLRKEVGLDVSDRIRISYSASDELAAAITQNENYLAGETLAVEITRSSDLPATAAEIKLGDDVLRISIAKA